MANYLQDACCIIFCNQNISHETQANVMTSYSWDAFVTSITCAYLSGWMINVIKNYLRKGYTVLISSIDIDDN
jgi:hypothetical protein